MSKNEAKLDARELDFPETVFIRDIENRVFQSLVLKAIDQVEGVYPLEANLIGNLLNMGHTESFKGIYVDQDSKNHSVSVKVELNIGYGISIPHKAAELQAKISEEIVKFTGLHVAQVHTVFKGMSQGVTKRNAEEAEECLDHISI